MVQPSLERLKWEHGALPTALGCSLKHVLRKTHSLHDTRQSQLSAGTKKGVLTTTCIYVFVVSFWQSFSCNCYSTILIFKQCLLCSFKIAVRISFMQLVFCVILSDILRAVEYCYLWGSSIEKMLLHYSRSLCCHNMERLQKVLPLQEV